RAESLKESGKRLHEINFKYNSRDVLAWSIEHENQAEMKGLYPKVLKEFLIKRNSLKRCLAPLNDRKEELEKEISLAEIRGENITDALKSKYSSVSFIDTYLDTKSLALKVYMNTFYSEAENSGFPFFLRALASGDTDSLYLVCPEECFQKCDEAYDNGNGISKEEYWSRIVNISIEVIEKLRDEVNDFLRNDNGSSYLKIAYEEVLFPVMNNSRTLHQIVKDVLKEIINDILQIDLTGMDRHTREEADAKQLIKKGLTSKPYLYEITELGEHFEYIIVENDSSQRIGDKMEYPEFPAII
ncbi:4137_t:CDS:2, partial [Funneliformis geosporum]